MAEERVDAEVEEVLSRALPEMGAGWRARATAAVQAASRERAHASRCTGPIAVAIAIALFGLGFVPIPLGRTHGALDRAIAALDRTSGFYKRSRQLRHGDEKSRIFEVWAAPGGLVRMEYWEEGKLQNWQVRGADFEAFCNPQHQWAEVYDLPPTESQEVSYETLERIREELMLRREHTGATMREWRERSLWGGEVQVIETTEPVEDRPGESRRMRFEMDPVTGRLISEKHWRRQGNGSELVAYSEEVAWDVDIPSDTWTFVPPRGWRVKYHRWWAGRAENTLASGETEDWQVSVHAIDADQEGDLVVTLSRLPVREVVDGGQRIGPINLTGVDDLGVNYEAGHDRQSCQRGRHAREYWVIPLKRLASPIAPALSRAVTLTVQPASYEPYADQLVVLPDLPLPRPQDSVDPQQTEVVQY